MALPVINDGVLLQNTSDDSDPFPLAGGYYAMAVVATSYSTAVALNLLGPDGSTYLAMTDPAGDIIASFTANGAQSGFQLPPGVYKVDVGSSTGVYAAVARVNV